MSMIYFYLLILLTSTTRAANRTIYFGGFYPLTNAFSSWGRGCLPAALLAVDHLNERDDILAGLDIELVNKDTQGSPGVATRELFAMLQEGPAKAAILGPFPSHVAQAVAQTARWWNIPQVSPAAFTPELSDRAEYPTFFRTRAALTTFNPARIAFVRAFGWRRVAILTRQTNYFIKTADEMQTEMTRANLTVVTSEVFQNDQPPREELQRIKSLNARIIFVLSYEEYARKIFCTARKLGMYGPRYVWVLHYGNDPLWMKKGTADGACTAAEIDETAEGHFIISDVTLREDGVLPISGRTPRVFLEEYRRKVVSLNSTLSEFYAPLTYDAVWSLAMALNASLNPATAPTILDTLTYDSTPFRRATILNMYNVHFEGMTSTVKFSSTGNVASLTSKIKRYKGDRFLPVAYHVASNDSLVWLSQITWDGGRVPFDNLQTEYHEGKVIPWVFYLMTSLATCGMMGATFYLWYNVSKRNTKFIRMSSPSLNNLTIVAGFFTYLTVLLSGVSGNTFPPSHVLWICRVCYPMLAVGYSLGFGALFAKTWRVFKIFTSVRKGGGAKRVIISDVQLFGLVGVFVLLDVVYFIVWYSIDGLFLDVTYSPPLESAEDPDVLVIYWVTSCTSRSLPVWHAILYVIKGLLLIFGAFLAWQTRGVAIPALNDSKYIGVAVYNVTVICLLAIIPSLFLKADDVNAKYVISSICILVATTLTQAIIFIPKVMGFHDDKVGPDRTTVATQQTNMQLASVSQAPPLVCPSCNAVVIS